MFQLTNAGEEAGKNKMNLESVYENKFESQPLRGMKILLVEDSVDNQTLVKMIISKTGAEMDIASDGLEGIYLARKNEYSVVLMDLHMPNMDGHEATKTLRDEGFEIPIIALTAHDFAEVRSLCLESGFSSFLPKPLKRNDLYEILEEIHYGYSDRSFNN